MPPETTETPAAPPADDATITSVKQGPLILTPTRGALTVRTGIVYRDIEPQMAIRAIDAEARQIEFTLSSEAEVQRWWGSEILDHQKSSVRLDRTGRFFPFLLEHATRDHLGVFVKFWLADEMTHGVVRFGKSARAEENFADHADGIKGLTSIGYRMHHLVLESEEDGWPTYRVMDWEPLEASSVAVPADITVGVVAGDRAMGRGGLPLYTRPGEWMPGIRGEFETRVTRAIKSKPVISTPAARSLTTNADDERGEAMPEVTPAAPTPPAQPVTVERAQAPQIPQPQDRNAEVTRMLSLGDMYANPSLARQYVAEGRSEAQLHQALFAWRSTGDPTRDQPSDADVGLSGKETRQWSLLKAVRYLMDPTSAAAREEASLEIEVSEAARKQMAGKVSFSGGRSLVIPREIQRRSVFANLSVAELQRHPHLWASYQRALLQATGTGTGAELVQTSVLGGDFIDVLRSKTFLGSRVRVIRDVTGNIAIPRKVASTGLAAAATENATATEATISLQQVTATPHRLTAYKDFSKQLLIQGTPDAEALVGDDLMAQARVKTERDTLTGSATGEVTGIRGTSGVATVAAGGAPPDRDHMIDMETAVATADADVGDLLYVTTPGIRGVLKKAPTDAGSGIYTWANDRVNDYLAFATTMMPSTLSPGTSHGILFGNFMDIVWIFWAAMELSVDDVSAVNTKNYQATVVLNQLWDMIVRHGASFAKTDDATLT